MNKEKKMSLRKSLLGAKIALALSLPLVGASNLLANNVVAAREGSLVTIFGDNANNLITISQNSAGDLSVIGRNGTTVNGLTSVRFRQINLNAMEVRMEGGDDVVTFTNVAIANDLYVNLGEGNDRVLTGATPTMVGASVAIEGGMGNEVVSLTNWMVGGDLSINGEGGVLNATLAGVSTGFNTTLIGDSAADIIRLSRCFTGEATWIESKEGADRVTVADHSGLDLFVNTDVGNDTISLTNIEVQQDIGVFTGTQNDSVSMVNVISGKNLVVSLDSGNDSFYGQLVDVAFDAIFEWGVGTDTFTDRGISAGIIKEVKEFEIFP
jgi:hypothetical protein